VGVAPCNRVWATQIRGDVPKASRRRPRVQLTRIDNLCRIRISSCRPHFNAEYCSPDDTGVARGYSFFPMAAVLQMLEDGESYGGKDIFDPQVLFIRDWRFALSTAALRTRRTYSEQNIRWMFMVPAEGRQGSVLSFLDLC
jgi:hypothetical protein